MSKDIRVALSFFDHPKTRKLVRKFGKDAAWGLLRLWAYAAEFRPDGDLSGMTSEDIALIADVNESLTERYAPFLADDCRYLDRDQDGNYSLHNWREHNPWVAGFTDRSDKARFSRLALTHPDIYRELQGKGVSAISREAYASLTAPQRFVNAALTPAPAPSPAPSPSPAPTSKELCPRKARAPRPPFKPPTLEEVTAYCKERGNTIDPEHFIAHHETRNWIPKGATKQMTSWKAAVITFEKNEKKFGGNGHAVQKSQAPKSFVEQKRERMAAQYQRIVTGGRGVPGRGSVFSPDVPGEGTDSGRGGHMDAEAVGVSTLEDGAPRRIPGGER